MAEIRPAPRLVARLDIKGAALIKGIQMEGIRKLGDPREFAVDYYKNGIDELIYMDSVASLYERDVIYDLVSQTAENVFVPITVGGGIRSVDEARKMLRAGADKIAINTAATKRPELISEVANAFGSQCMVLQIDAKKIERGWEVYCDCGREPTGLDAIEWAERVTGLGAGEILLTAIDKDGTRSGMDYELIAAVTGAVPIPVIGSGGVGGADHIKRAVTDANADAIAVASAFHYRKITPEEAREAIHATGAELCRH